MLFVLFRNHAWVSFQGFAEAYNDTHNLEKEEGECIKTLDAYYYNGYILCHH